MYRFSFPDCCSTLSCGTEWGRCFRGLGLTSSFNNHPTSELTQHKYTLHKLQTSPAACTPHNNNSTSVDFIEKRYISTSDEFYGILSHFYCEWISVLICMKVKSVLHSPHSKVSVLHLSDVRFVHFIKWFPLIELINLVMTVISIQTSNDVF